MGSIMLQEIAQQPAALEATLHAERPRVARLAERLRARDLRVIVLAARGSSDNAATYGRYALELLTGLPVSLSAPSIHTVYGAKLRLDRALVIGVSQSGEGDDILRVIERSRAAGAFTLGITNGADSSLARAAEEVLLMHGGPERSVAATKTYTEELLLLLLLAAELAGDAALIGSLDQIPAQVQAALARKVELEALVARHRAMENCVVVGRGLMLGNAQELALKLMETCYVVAERFSSADLMHGPLALIEKQFKVILFAPPGPTFPGIRELHQRLLELKADTTVIGVDPELLGRASAGIAMEDGIGELLAPIPYAVPAQLFAALLAEARGLNPDAPRSLSKVTRTL